MKAVGIIETTGQRDLPVASAANELVQLVIAERGIAEAGFLEDDGTVIIAQAGAEPLPAMALRAIRSIARIEHGGRRVKRAVLFIAPKIDPATMAARQLIARTLLGHAAAFGSAELWLILDAGAGEEVLFAHLGLIESLMEEVGSASMPIRLRFSSENGSAGASALVPPPVPEASQLRAQLPLSGR